MTTTTQDTLARIARLLPLAIIAGAVLAYSNSFSGEFIFDDITMIAQNPQIYFLWPPWKAVWQPTRPLADMTLALNYAIGRFNVADYHLANLLIHLAAGLFLYGVIRRTLLLSCWDGRYTETAPWLAAAVALLWTVHPLQTESVTYIIQRNESLMGLFYLMGLYFFVRGVGSARRIRGWLDAALAATLLGMGTKEMIVTLPAVMLIYDWIFVAPSARELIRARWKFHFAAWLTLAVFGLLLLLAVAKNMSRGGLLYTGITPIGYAMNEALVILYYLRLSFAPYPLCFDYAWTAEPLQNLILPALGVGALVALSVYGIVRRRWYGLVGAFFFLILAPTSSFMPVPDFIFEHRMYLPLAAVLLVAVIAAHALGDRLASRAPAKAGGLAMGGIAVAVAAAAGLGWLTYERNRDYISEVAMWRDIVAKRPDNFRAYNGLSTALINSDKKIDDEHLRNLVYEESMQVCRELLKRLPDFESMTIKEINRLGTQDPSIRAKKYYYVMAHSDMGAALFRLKRYAEAQVHNREALRVIPGHNVARSNMAFIHYLQKQTAEAITQWYEALKWDVNDLQTHFLLGIVFSEHGEYGKAIHHFRQILKFNPDHVFAAYRMAWLLASSSEDNLRDGPEALRLALRVNRILGMESIRGLDLLGIAYAATGDYSNAVISVERAIKLAEQPPHDQCQPSIALSMPSIGAGTNSTVSANYPIQAMKDRLQLFRSSKPFRHREGGADGFPIW